MSSDSIAISRDLVAAGAEQKLADAIAQKIVTHSDESLATKADLAAVKADIARLETKINMLTTLMVTMVGGLYVAMGAVVLGNFIGG